MNWLKLQSGSDVRGVAVGENPILTSQVAEKIAQAFSEMVAKTQGKPLTQVRISIGHDSRITGQALAAATGEGIANTGASAVLVGMCTTPAMYMSTIDEEAAYDGAIMVTASHHPYQMNGLKFFLPRGGLNSQEIKALLQRAEGLSAQEQTGEEGQHRGEILHQPYLSNYQRFLTDFIHKQLESDVAMPLLGLHVVVDAGNGAGGFYAELLEGLGAWIEGSQFLQPDGYFPNHPPNPENKEAMASLSKAVLAHEADIGIIFDADCDRTALVDSKGKEINKNRLIALVSAILLDKQPGITIVTDSVTSSGLAEFIGAWGGEHYRYKRGYRNVIDEAMLLNEAGIDCPLAIETSGHAAFRDNHFLDDGMYLATLLVTEAMKLKQDGKELSALIADLKEPVDEVEIRLHIEDEDFQRVGRECIEQLIAFGEENPLWTIAPDNREGVRYSFSSREDGLEEEGWFLLRLSVHDPVLALNIESDIPGGVVQVLKELLIPLKEAEGINVTPITDYLNSHQ